MENMLGDIKEILITEEAINQRVKELAQILSDEYRGKKPLVIAILKGAAPFMSDLTKRMDIFLEMDYMVVSSYGISTRSSGVVKIIKDLDYDISGRHLIIVEDVIDSGLTLNYIVDLLKRRAPRSLKVVTLLNKPKNRQTALTPDYIGFEVPDEFVVGYGLDYAEQYRNLPFIGILKPQVYAEK